MAPEIIAIKINTNCQMQQSDKTNRGSTNHNHFSEVKTNSGEVIELSKMEKENWDKTSSDETLTLHGLPKAIYLLIGKTLTSQ